MSEHLDSLNLVELLNLLEPVPEPPPVSMWPQTPGWAVLAVLALGLAWALTWTVIRRRRAGAYRRAALVELGRAGDDPATIAKLLRRTALAAYPRAKVAGLSGTEWLAFLDRTGGNGFRDGPGRALVSAPYRGGHPDPALTDLARRWIKRHQPGTGGL